MKAKRAGRFARRAGSAARRGILELARESVDNQLRNGVTCPMDTDGDGDCGRRYCPVCGTMRQNAPGSATPEGKR